jgi:hypothetical protein
MICTDCMRNSLEEVGGDIWEGGEEKQYICDCSPDRIRSVAVLWPDDEYDCWKVVYSGIYERQTEAEFYKWV